MKEFITYGHSNLGRGSQLLTLSRLRPTFRANRTKRSNSTTNFSLTTCPHFISWRDQNVSRGKLAHFDWRRKVTTYTYDAGGNRNTITAPPLGAPPVSYITRMSYDRVGNLKTRTDPNMHTTLYDYDGLNRLIKQTDPAGNFDLYAYDGEGHRRSAIRSAVVWQAKCNQQCNWIRGVSQPLTRCAGQHLIPYRIQ